MDDDFLNDDFGAAKPDKKSGKKDEPAPEDPVTYVRKEAPPEEKKSALSSEEEIETLVARSAVAQKKQSQKKKQIKYGLSALGGLVFIYIVYLLFVPYKGTMQFGVCKVFLELAVPYPDTLRISTVVPDLPENSIRLWYVHTDAFGEYTMEPIRCYFKENEQDGLALDKVTIRRRLVDQEKVDDFNRSIPAIRANPPDLTLPPPIPDSLRDMQIETWRFRKPIL